MRERVLSFRLVPLCLALLTPGCNDDPPPTGGDPTSTTTTATSAPAAAYLRGAQLSEDARRVDFVVNGATLATGIDYGGVGPYAPLDPGEYRVQFFPEGQRGAPVIETRVNLLSNQTVTVAVVGLSLTTLTIVEDRSTRSDRARVKMVNTVPDFPAPFDLSIQNGPGLFGGIGYLQTSGTAELIPGVYGFVLRRGGTAEELAEISSQGLSAGANYTVYAIGTLLRDDIELLVTRNSF
jgi:hypothetical protein